MEKELNDEYYRRLFIPIVITILIFCGIFVIIATPPGSPVKWDTYTSVFGAQAKNLVAN